MWQWVSLLGLISWVIISSSFQVTEKLRSLSQAWVIRNVVSGTSLILQIQKYQNVFLDALFAGLSCVVSIPFYTGFLPLLFWSGHAKLARQMTILMAFCDYAGNCVKDVVSAPRPSCPPVRRITATKDEEENALEYGLPSSHTLNTVCLSGYLLHYVLSESERIALPQQLLGVVIVFCFVSLIGFGRIYLGMHSLVDIISGLFLGLVILTFWLAIHNHVDDFIVASPNVTTFWAGLSFCLLFAYPTPQHPSPSFEYHAAFTGVAFGIVAGVQQTFNQYHHEAVPRAFSELTMPRFCGRIFIGLPTILLVKFSCKELAIRIVPSVSNTLGLPVVSSGYVPSLNEKRRYNRQSSYLQKLLFFRSQETFDVDTGIRFLQYAGLAWSVVDLVPTLYSYAGL